MRESLITPVLLSAEKKPQAGFYFLSKLYLVDARKI